MRELQEAKTSVLAVTINLALHRQGAEKNRRLGSWRFPDDESVATLFLSRDDSSPQRLRQTTESPYPLVLARAAV